MTSISLFKKLSDSDKSNVFEEVGEIVSKEVETFYGNNPDFEDIAVNIGQYFYQAKDKAFYCLWFSIYVYGNTFWWNPLLLEESTSDDYLDAINKSKK